MKKLVIGVALILSVTVLANPAAVEAKNRVLALRGSDIGFDSTVPDIDGDGQDDAALCFELDLINLTNDKVIGTALDCLSEINAVGDGLALIGTTVFNFKRGTVITQGETTVQPKTHGGRGFTNYTGARSNKNAVVGGDGIFAGARGSSQLSGAVKITPLADGRLRIKFDCFFVLHLDVDNP